ncbi:hypothetical protein FYJ28_06685 [Arthrobacter sp. BL-252-APC-1A]|uniref:hypothetical protein n=1 Tax=Arthrobacter sp. BL-252-APC-1A TaxID=2606622 RepID=UPI0012B3152C|nr:hypothetical protein [Arthrobacter sp. BL-252-APC-1A]MSR98511.1 hypothetical protein [Arthrobacter sp. BL-252-APC-1A]
MGNTHTPEGAGHDYYRRPADGVEPQRSMQMPSVQIVDDGAGNGGSVHVGAGADAAGAGGSERSGIQELGQAEPAGAVPAPVPVWQRFNFALTAAWTLVAVLLAVGLAWLTGAFSAPQMYYDPSTNQPSDGSSTVITMNLYSMGPFMFLFGILGAFTLLVVQSARFRRPGR